MTKPSVIPSHKIVRHLTEVVMTPEHIKRKESSMFKKSKERLNHDGHYVCYVCGSTEELEVHHYAAEWSLEADIDFEKLKEFLEEWDIYGYGKLLRKLPITGVDDIRNMMVLCQEHHRGGSADGSANGIHNITFPIWISQKLAKAGIFPVPTTDSELTRFKK